MLNKVNRYFSRNLSLIILFVFTLIFISFTVKNLVFQNLIGDEAVYIVEGDRYIHEPYSFYRNSGSPSLLKIITAIPYAFIPLDRDYSPYYNQVFTNVYTVSNFIYTQNESYAEYIIVLARIPHLLLSLLLGYSIFLFSKRLLSLKVALIALAFYAFHATFLAHASTSNLDIGVTAFTFWALCSIYYYLHTPKDQFLHINRKAKLNSTQLLVITAILLGASQATKISAILLYPFLLFWFFTTKTDKKLRDIGIIICLSLLTLWAIYLFQIGPILTADDTPAGIESIYGSIPVIKNYKTDITKLLYLPIYPLGAYLNNFTYQFSHSFFGHTNFINGVFTNQRIWYYIPLVLTIKNSIIFIISCIAGIVALIWSKSHRTVCLFLSLWILFILIWSMQSKIQLGMRYVLPMFPMLFILAANGLAWSASKLSFKNRNIIIVTALIIYILSTLRVGTNYFTYIGELYYGRNPVDLVFDSDYDWGQSVYALGDAQISNNMYPLYFMPYIGGDLKHEQIKNETDPVTAFYNKYNGYYAFSHSSFVNMKHKHPEIFSFFYSKRPTDIINRTIYVYEIKFK